MILGAAVKRKKARHAGDTWFVMNKYSTYPCLFLYLSKIRKWSNSTSNKREHHCKYIIKIYHPLFPKIAGMTNLKGMKNRPMILIGGWLAATGMNTVSVWIYLFYNLVWIQILGHLIWLKKSFFQKEGV